jgi:hypothetical protein
VIGWLQDAGATLASWRQVVLLCAHACRVHQPGHHCAGLNMQQGPWVVSTRNHHVGTAIRSDGTGQSDDVTWPGSASPAVVLLCMLLLLVLLPPASGMLLLSGMASRRRWLPAGAATGLPPLALLIMEPAMGAGDAWSSAVSSWALMGELGSSSFSPATGRHSVSCTSPTKQMQLYQAKDRLHITQVGHMQSAALLLLPAAARGRTLLLDLLKVQLGVSALNADVGTMRLRCCVVIGLALALDVGQRDA